MPEITIIAETFKQEGELSHNKIRLRPIPGQGYEFDVRVWYDVTLRHSHPVGTLLKLAVIEVRRGRKLYLRADQEGEVVSWEEARAFVKHLSRR